MQKNHHFNFLFLFEFPFFLLWRIIKYTLYYSIITIFFITIFIYFILPIRHNIFAIYKLIFLIKEIIRIFCAISPTIILKCNTGVLHFNSCYIEDINFILEDKKNYIIYTKINSCYDALTLFKLMKNNEFYINFYNKKNFHTIEKKTAEFIEFLQKQSIKRKKKIAIRIIICSNIPDDNFLKNNYNKNKEIFILLPQKNKATIFYLINKIYTNNTN
jgi:hypothetical protein